MYDIRENDPTREVQKYLLEISYATHGLPHLAIDGIYGEETRGTVRLFQERNRLPVTGTVDYATWNELYRQYGEAREERLARTLPPLRDPLPITLRTSGSDVSLIQILLAAVSRSLYPLGFVPEEGRYDLATQRAVRAYQRFRSLPPSGSVDRDTLAALWEDYKNLPPDGGDREMF